MNKHVCKKCNRELPEGFKKDICVNCENKRIGKVQNFCKGAAAVVATGLSILFFSKKNREQYKIKVKQRKPRCNLGFSYCQN